MESWMHSLSSGRELFCGMRKPSGQSEPARMISFQWGVNSGWGVLTQSRIAVLHYQCKE